MEDAQHHRSTKTLTNGSSGGVRRGDNNILLPPETPRDRRRLKELLDWVIGPDIDNRLPWAKELECCEAAIRRRQKEGVCRKRDDVIRKLGSTPKMVDNAEERDWQVHLKTLPFQQPPRSKSSWMLRTPDLIAYIRTIGQ